MCADMYEAYAMECEKLQDKIEECKCALNLVECTHRNIEAWLGKPKKIHLFLYLCNSLF